MNTSCASVDVNKRAIRWSAGERVWGGRVTRLKRLLVPNNKLISLEMHTSEARHQHVPRYFNLLTANFKFSECNNATSVPKELNVLLLMLFSLTQ